LDHSFRIFPHETTQEGQSGQSAAIAGLCECLVKEHATQKFSYVALLSSMQSSDSPLRNMDLQALRDKIRQQLPSLVNTALDWRRLENVAKRVDPATLQAGVS